MGLLDNYRIKKSIHKLLSLRSPKDPELTRVVERLQQIGEPVIPYLVQALNASHNRENVVATLVTFVNNHTIPTFLSALLNATPRATEGLLNALTQADHYDPNQLISLFANPKLSVPSLEKLFLRHKTLLQPHALLRVLPTAPKQNHTAILRLVEQVVTEDVVPELLHHLRTDDHAVRLSIVRILCRFKTGAVQESFVRLLSDPHKPIRLQALEGLVAMNMRFDTEPLCRLLSDSDAAVQRQALDVLLRMMLDESETARQRAVDGLNAVGNATILKQIFTALKSQEWWITLRIADALGMHGGPQLTEAVLKLLSEQDRFLSQCAFEVIHTLKDEQALAALITTLQDNEIRDRVANAIAALGDKRAVPLVLHMLERDAEAALIATSILVALKEPQAIPPLLEQLLSADKTLVKETLRALAVLTNAEYAPEVLQSVMAIRDNAAEDIKELANKMATTIIKRFGRQVLPQNVQEQSTSHTPTPSGLTQAAAPHASGVAATPLSTSSMIKSGATINIAMLEPGMILADRYRIIRHVGEGGFSTVLLVDDTMVHEDVILKILNPQVAMGDEMVKRFIQELRYARKVTHENVIRIYDILAIGHSYAISMEYFTSHTLADEVQNETPLNTKRGIKIIFDVCRGISAAHQVDIVHRDLKPLNILINDQGLVKVVDFGVAAVTNQMGTRLTRVGTLLGTPAYVAPEQVRSRTIDARTDIYSLGVVMYEVFTGSPPYNGDDMSILFQHVEGNLTPPRSINSEMPEALDAIIRKAMSVDPDRRFQSMDELRKSLVTFSRQLT
jgi:serine/threonine-protein kinase